MSAKYKSPSFLLPNELNTSANPLNTDGNPATGTGINSLYSMDFNGSSYISISDISVSGEFTLSAWVKGITSSTFYIFGSTNTSNWFRIQGGNAVNLKVGNGQLNDSSPGTIPTFTFNSTDWYHIVATRDSSNNIQVYVNGSVDSSYTPRNTDTPVDANFVPNFIGRNQASYTTGKIDEIAIFNKALTSTERAALYDGTGSNIRPSNLMATNLGPIAYYPLGEQAQNSGYPSATGNEWQFPNGVLQDYVMDFDGNNQYINAGVISALSNVSEYSISLWANIDTGASGTLRLFGNRESSSPFNGIGADIDLSASLYFYLNGGPSYPVVQVANISNYVTAGTWFNLICTFNSGQAYIFINGIQRGSATGSSTADTTTNPLYIGADPINTGSYFDGQISNFVLWSSDQSTNKDNIYNNGSPQTTYTVTPQNWWKLNADSVYTPSVSKYPTSLNFASSSYIISSSSVITGNSDRTVSVWAKTPNYTSKKAIFSLGDTTGSGSTTKFAIRINGTDDIQIASKGYDFLFSNTGIIVTDNNWHHFAATYSYSGSTAYFKLYIDGNYIGEQTGSLQLNTSAGFSIGTWGYGTNRDFFNGDISNAVVYNSELKATQISTLFNFGTPETTPSFSPVAWWKLDDQNAITDSSGNGHTGNNNGATDSPGTVALIPSWKIPSALPITSAANYTTALDFDGGDHASFPFNVSTIGTNNYSTSFWFNYNAGDLEDYPYLYGFGASADYQAFGLTGKVGDTYNIRINNNYNNNYTQTISTGNVISAGVWYNVTITRDGNTINCYLNGDPLITLSNSDVSNNNLSASSFKLGWGDFVSNRYFNSKVSNFAIFNTDLSASQVSTLYNGGTPETAISFSPISWWKLDTGGSTITDYGSAGNNGTNNGATQVTSDVLTTQPVNGVSTTLPSTALQQSDLQFDSPYSNYSLSFDGISYINTGTGLGDSLGGSYSGDLTVSMWLKFGSTSAQYGLFYIGDLAGGSSGSFWINTSASKLWVYASNGTAGYINCSISSLNTTDWYNVTCVYKGYDISNSKIYINNVPQTLTTFGNFNYTYDFTGKKTTIADYYTTPPFRGFNGKIDETAIFNTALTEAQVLEIYNNGKPGDLDNFSGTAPISWWRLGENAYFNTGTTPGPEFTVPNSITGAPNGIGSGTVATMLSADAPGTYANGIGDGLAITDRVGDAPLSVANSQSYNMIPDDKVPYVPGYVGAQTTNAFEMTFDGTNYFNAGNASSLNWGTGDGSVSCWFKTSYNAPGVQDLVINGSYASGGKGYILYLDSSERVGFYLDDNSSPSGVLSTSSVNDGDWHHVVGVRDSGTMKLYLDGSEIATGTDNTGNIDISDPLIIGAGQAFGGSVGNFFNGQIDEVAIFDKALTADQIKFDLYEPTALVGGVEKTADIENNTNLPTPLAWYRMGD